MRSRSLSFGLQVCVGAHDTDGCVSVTDRTLINSFKHGLSLCVCLLGGGVWCERSPKIKLLYFF